MNSKTRRRIDAAIAARLAEEGVKGTHVATITIALPENYQIEGVDSQLDSNGNVVGYNIKITTQIHVCPFCGEVLERRKDTHIRTLQDLPIMGLPTILSIEAGVYRCNNPECSHCGHYVTEDLGPLAPPYARNTTRLDDLIVYYGITSNAQDAVRQLEQIGVYVDRTTVCRKIVSIYERMEIPGCGFAIGIDDYSTKRGFLYMTIICDVETHKPIAVLKGRDGKALADWLKRPENRNVRVVTRDRASAYAQAIANVIPDAIQIADRFHLYDNLLDAVSKAVRKIIPKAVRVPVTAAHSDKGDLDGQKADSSRDADGEAEDADSSSAQSPVPEQPQEAGSELDPELVELANKLRKHYATSKSFGQTAWVFGLSVYRVRQLILEPIEKCCVQRTPPTRLAPQSSLDPYAAIIIPQLEAGVSGLKIYEGLRDRYPLSLGTFYKAFAVFKEEHGFGSGPATMEVKVHQIISWIWSGKSLPDPGAAEFLLNRYPKLYVIRKCVQEFRFIFSPQGHQAGLYLFIEKYGDREFEFAEIKSFANGLNHDLEAVEMAVSSPLSNGFVEGMNNRTKTIKRGMYGRCGDKLLAAKIILPYYWKRTPQAYYLRDYTGRLGNAA